MTPVTYRPGLAYCRGARRAGNGEPTASGRLAAVERPWRQPSRRRRHRGQVRDKDRPAHTGTARESLMKAVVYDAPQQYSVKEVPTPEAGPGEVRIKVHQV